MRAARSGLAAAGSRRPGGQPDAPAAPSAATRETPGKGHRIGDRRRRNQCAANHSSVSPGMGSPGQRGKAGEAGGRGGRGIPVSCVPSKTTAPPPTPPRVLDQYSSGHQRGKYGVGKSCHLEKDSLTTWLLSCLVSIGRQHENTVHKERAGAPLVDTMAHMNRPASAARSATWDPKFGSFNLQCCPRPDARASPTVGPPLVARWPHSSRACF